jgi:TPR repeat protein
MAQAIAWYRKAADQGDAMAQMNLAIVYDQGIGIAQDYSEAAGLYRKAAEQGLPQAQYNLGLLYLYGRGMPKNGAQAAEWMRKAAEQGETAAQYNLGVCYISGDGVDRDISEGYFWIFLANARTTDSGLKQYTETSLREDADAMKKSDIKNAQKRAQAWLNEHPLKPEP